MNIISILSKRGQKSKKASQSNISAVKDSISQITVTDYQKIVFDNDLSSLVISGSPNQQELTDAKNSLLYEFSIACGSNVSTPIMNSYRRIHLYKNKIASLNVAQSMLSVWDEELTAFLHEMKVKYFPGEVEKTAKMITRKIKMIQVSLKEESTRYQKLISDNGPVSELTPEEFERQLSTIGKYMGYRIDKNKTFLSEYAAYIYSYRKELENGRNRQRN